MIVEIVCFGVGVALGVGGLWAWLLRESRRKDAAARLAEYDALQQIRTIRLQALRRIVDVGTHAGVEVIRRDGRRG